MLPLLLKSKNPNLRNKAGIYFILNTINGKFYIGSAADLDQRWRTHKSYLNLNKHNNSYLQYSWNKYGSDSFEFVCVELIKNKSDLYKIEQLWIDASNCCNPKIGYNAKPSAYNSSGYKHTAEAKNKISKAHKASGLKPPSPLGRKNSLETRAKMSAAMKDIKKSTTVNMKKPKSEAHKLALSMARRGTKLSEETKRKIGKSGRDFDKWPCADGNKCNCEKCRKNRYLYYQKPKQKK